MPEHTPSTAHDIVAGLQQEPPRISPIYFYDTVGSSLFEEITRLPEYYPTRTERSIMEHHGADIAATIGSGYTLIELGAGNCEKARALCRLIHPERFIGVDIASEFLLGAVAALQADFPWLLAQAITGDLHQPVQLPADVPLARRLVFYPGSSIGNFDRDEALALLRRIRDLLARDGALLLGVDLVKDSAVLNAAYADAQGVTAAFNRNILVHVNRLIGADFDPMQWDHVAFYDEAQARIEMHLQARSAQSVHWAGGSRAFPAGTRIHTEFSHKHTPAGITALLAEAGFHQVRIWTDAQDWFAVVLARP